MKQRIFCLLLFLFTPFTSLVYSNTSSSPNKWQLLIIEKFRIQIIVPKTNSVRIIQSNGDKKREKQYISGKVTNIYLPTCIDANYILRVILCSLGNNSFIDYTTGEITQTNIPAYGPISPDGRYIVDRLGRGIYDLKTRKLIFNSDESWYSKDADYNKRIHPSSLTGIEVRSNIRPDGRFLLITTDERGQPNSTLYEANIYDILKHRGKGFKLKKYSISLNNFKHIESHLGNGKYLASIKLDNKSKATVLKIIEKSSKDWRHTYSRCWITPDKIWAACHLVNRKGKIHVVIYSIRQKKIIKTLKVPNFISIWVWTGDPKKRPSYIK